MLLRPGRANAKNFNILGILGATTSFIYRAASYIKKFWKLWTSFVLMVRMEMVRLCWALSLALSFALLISASSILPHHTDEESLKSALDAVTRKQRSLDFSPPRDYYNDSPNFKYRPNDAENEDAFVRQPEQDLEDEDDDLEFLPIGN